MSDDRPKVIPINGSQPEGLPAPKELRGGPPGGRKATLVEARSIFSAMVASKYDQGGGVYAIPVEDLVLLLVNAEVDACRISTLHELLLGAKIVTPSGVRVITQDQIEQTLIGKMTQRMIQLQHERDQAPRVQVAGGPLPPAKDP